MKAAGLRILLFVFCAIVSAIAAVFGEPLVRHNDDAIVILTTVLTVFAGFLVAIIAVLGDPALISEGSWRAAESRRESVERQLIVHTWLFLAYLVAIVFLFVGVLVRDAAVPEVVKVWIGRAYLFLGVLSFLFTFGLAKSMLTYQLARFEAEIKKRRAASGLKD